MVDKTYESILDAGSWDELPEEKLLPEGSYRLRGRNVVTMPPKEAGQSERVLFFYNVVEAMDDVDADELASLGEDYDISENETTAQFFVGKKKEADRVRKHLALHGIEVPTREQVAKGATPKTIAESFEEFKGSEVIAWLKQDTYTDSSGVLRQSNKPINFTAIE